MSVPAEFLNQLFTRKSAAFSGCSLIIYDYLATFPLEVNYIWNAPWTTTKLGFLLNRYGNLVGQTFITFEETGYLNYPYTKEFCAMFGFFIPFFMLFSGESIRILVLLRAWAIWGCTYRVTVSLITLYILYVLAVIAIIIYSQAMVSFIPLLYLKQVNVCIVPIPPYIWVIWFATLVLDTVVLVMVGHSLRKLFRESRDLYPSPLIHLLVRDAVLFYATSMFNSVFTIVCWSVFHIDPRNFLELALSLPLLSVVGQRLILNLRGFQGQRFTTRDISREVDRQIAGMGDLFWPDIGADNEQADGDQSESSNTSRTTGTIDLGLAVTEIQRGQGASRSHSPLPVTMRAWEV